MASQTDDGADWKQIDYQLAHSDIRWAKEQGWRALQWVLLLQAGILGLFSQLEDDLPKWLFVKASLLTAVVGAYYIFDLYLFARKSRVKADSLRDSDGDAEQHWDKHHVRYLVIRLAIVAGALAASLAIIADSTS